jgi:hypothetical protein
MHRPKNKVYVVKISNRLLNIIDKKHTTGYIMTFQNQKDAALCSKSWCAKRCLSIGLNTSTKKDYHLETYTEEICLDTLIDDSYAFNYNVFVCTCFHIYSDSLYINGTKIHTTFPYDDINFDLMKYYLDELILIE